MALTCANAAMFRFRPQIKCGQRQRAVVAAGMLDVMETPAHQRRQIEEYLRSQSGDDFEIEHVEKLTSEYVLGQQYDVWDAHTSDGRWWVITNPVNLYSQDQIKSMDIALSFHIGLMSRVMERQPPPSARQSTWMLEVTRRLDVASESLDRAREVEDFQAVGMRLRETLLTLAARLAGLGYQTVAGVADLQQGNFKAWPASAPRWWPRAAAHSTCGRY